MPVHIFEDGIKCPWFFPGKCVFFWSAGLLHHKDTGYSSFAQSARKEGYLQGRDAHKRGTCMLGMFSTGTASRTDSAVHTSEPVAAWTIQARNLTGNISLQS